MRQKITGSGPDVNLSKPDVVARRMRGIGADEKPSPLEWLEYLYDRMRAPLSGLLDNKVAFITFNYDRLVEHFSFEAFRASYGLTSEDGLKLVGQMKIVHVHGMLGAFGLKTDAGARAFDAELSFRAVESKLT